MGLSIHKPNRQPKPFTNKRPKPTSKSPKPTTLTALGNESWRSATWAIGLGRGIKSFITGWVSSLWLMAVGFGGITPFLRFSGWGKPKYA